jgi:hypothetical protein
VVGLLGVVALFALASIATQARRVLRGVKLEVDAGRGTVAGVTAPAGVVQGYAAAEVEVPLSELEAVVLSLHRDTGSGSSHRAVAHLELLLRDGRRLQGPEAFSPPQEWDEARDRLAPVAAELARLAQKPLVLEYRFSGQRLELASAELGTRGPAA